MKDGLRIVLILVTLTMVYLGFQYLQDNPTGYGVYEGGSINALDGFEIPAGFNRTRDGIVLVKQENILEKNFTAYNSSILVSAFEGSSNKTSKVSADDGNEFELEDDEILNVTFSDALVAGDVVTLHSDDSQNKGVELCTPGGN